MGTPPDGDEGRETCALFRLSGREWALLREENGGVVYYRFNSLAPYDGLVHGVFTRLGGVSNGIARKAIPRMKKAYGCRPSDMLAGIGPSIGPCCYQIGENVVKSVMAAFGGPLDKQADGSFHFDLWEATRLQLTEMGVGQIEVARMCTACRSDEFFSHRADGGRTGRFAAIIGITNRG